MLRSIRTFGIFLYALPFVFVGGVASQAQNTQKNTAAKAKSFPFAYSVQPVLLPSSVSAILLKSHLNIAYRGHVLLRGFALNDKGEAAFAIVSESKNALVGGVYTGNRTVVSIGDIVSGLRIKDFKEVQINNQGQVSYVATGVATGTTSKYPYTNPVKSIFVEKLFVGLCPFYGHYLLSDNGQVYVFRDVFDDGSVSFSGVIGINYDMPVTYKSQAIPSLAQHSQDNAPAPSNVPIKSLPDDIIQKLKTIVFRNSNGFAYWMWEPKGPTLAKGSDGNSSHAIYSGPAGPLYHEDGYSVWNKEVFLDIKAKGLEFSAGQRGQPDWGPGISAAVNNQGQMLFPVPPTPQDTRIFVLALATPDNAPGPEPDVLFSSVLTDDFKTDLKNTR